MKDNLPDVVIGGINPGPNIGDAVFYSGTVGVAAEAAFYGVPGIAVSLGDRATEQEEFSGVAEFLVELLKEFDSLDFSERRFININGPKGTAADINGVVVTRAGTARFLDKFVQRESRNGKPEVWRNEGDRMELSRDEDDLDDRALERGHISVTPMHLDITDFQARANLALVLNKIDPRTNRHAPGDVTDRESHVEEVSPFPTGN
jgi:5'-nucleotidase